MRSAVLIVSFVLAFTTACVSSQPRSAPAETTSSESTTTPTSAADPDRTVVLNVKGLSCPLCAHNIDKQLHRIPGVERVAVNLGNGQVRVVHAPAARPTDAQLSDAVNAGGFTLESIQAP